MRSVILIKMIAKRNGTCYSCGGKLIKGEPIIYCPNHYDEDKQMTVKVAWCTKCSK